MQKKVNVEIVSTFNSQYLELNRYDFNSGIENGGTYAMHVYRLYGIDNNGNSYLLSETRVNREYDKDKKTLLMFENDYNNIYAPKSNIQNT